MGYPTDVREKTDYEVAGMDPTWADLTGMLSANEDRPVLSVSGKAGQLNMSRLISKSNNIAMNIFLDGIQINAGYMAWPGAFIGTYGASMEGGTMRLVRYDTVNGRYILELARPLKFGSSLQVRLVNLNAAAARAYWDAVWEENT